MKLAVFSIKNFSLGAIFYNGLGYDFVASARGFLFL